MNNFKYIDIHAHVNFAAYQNDLDMVMQHAHDNQTIMINVGTQIDTSQRAVQLAEQHDHVYAVVGVHPIHTDASHHDQQELGEGNTEFTSRGEVFDTGAYQQLIDRSDRVVGIGECGLDYYRTTPESLEKQITAFRAQIELAIRNNLPLMLHVRPSQGSMDAYHDALDILEGYQLSALGTKLQGDFHFFAGDTAVAQRILDLGFYMSFTGVITFTHDYDEVIRMIPMDRIMTETDCPYVTPVPYRGKRNEPAHVKYITKKIAEIKGIEPEEASRQLLQNAVTFFNLEI